MKSAYTLLEEFQKIKQLATANLTRLKLLLAGVSKGQRYGGTWRCAASSSMGATMPAKSLELRRTIRLIREQGAEIADIEASIRFIIEALNSLRTIGMRMAAMILAEAGNFSGFDLPGKILVYATLSPFSC